MGKIDSVVETIKGELYDLQTALDDSSLANEHGVCYPIEEWIKVVLAAYSVNACVGDESDNNDDTHNSIKNGEEWLGDDYWKDRILGAKDLLDDYKGKGLSPCSCDYWKKNNYGLPSEIDLFYAEEGARMLDAGEASYKTFNRIHLYNGDKNLTVGFQHLAATNEQQLFEYIAADGTIHDEFCKYIVYRLMKKDASKYRLQAANDAIIKKRLFPNKKDAVIAKSVVDSIKTEEWLDAIKFFFSSEGVLKKSRPTGELSKKKRVSYLAYWAEHQMKEYCKALKDPETKENIHDGVKKGRFTYKEDPSQNVALLFQGEKDNPDTFLSGFWFHDIVKDALILKTVGAVQIKFFIDNFVTKAFSLLSDLFGEGYNRNIDKTKHNNLIVTAGILTILSWINSASGIKYTTTIDKKTKNLSVKSGTRKYTLTKEQYSKPSTQSIEEVSSNDNTEDIRLATVLLAGLAYNKYKEKYDDDKKPKYHVRARMKYIWDNYLVGKWGIKNTGKEEMPTKTDNWPKYDMTSKIYRMS